MGDSIVLETTFLIDLERELTRNEIGPAQEFLEQHPADLLHITFTVAGELAAGPRADRSPWEALIRPFRILGSDDEVCWRYGRLYRYLAENGLLIGTNDLWIAATALVHDMPVVTRNERHFRRVPELEILGYQ